jgi:hypothetical protein
MLRRKEMKAPERVLFTSEALITKSMTFCGICLLIGYVLLFAVSGAYVVLEKYIK